MNRLRNFLYSIAIALSLCTFAGALPNELVRGSAEDEAAVVEQTKKSIGLLDAGEHGAAWDQAAKPFQDITPRVVFIASIKSMRGFVGQVKDRSLQGIGFTRELQDAPPGHYAIVFLETTFANANALEEQIVFSNQNGQWRLTGYFLKKRRSANK